MKKYAIIEIGSNNTKTHIYQDKQLIYEDNTTIEFKKNYKIENKIISSDLDKLYDAVNKALIYTNNIHIYGLEIYQQLNLKKLIIHYIINTI